MSERFRWGILSTGRIAGQFADSLKNLPDAELVAVGSRTREAADRFGDAHGVPRRHVGYEALAADPEVDAIYVATPHHLHKENTLLCIRAGKAVLCEKPLAINAAEAAVMLDAARERGVFLMEAMWTRFIPLVGRLRELVRDGAIGEVRMISADFGFRAPVDEWHRLFNPETGGGALLDVGVYTVSLGSMLCGPALRVAALAHIGSTDVDEEMGILVQYGAGRIGVMYTALRVNTPHEAMILGTEGRIRIHAPFWKPTAMTVSRAGADDEVIEMPFDPPGYQFEAEEVMRCVRAGRPESPIMPLDESLRIMKTLDELRAQCGLRYPME